MEHTDLGFCYINDRTLNDEKVEQNVRKGRRELARWDAMAYSCASLCKILFVLVWFCSDREGVGSSSRCDVCVLLTLVGLNIQCLAYVIKCVMVHAMD